MKSLNYLTKDDFYQVKLGSMLASYDRDLLTTLYQPIVGYAALAVYFTLWSEVKRAEFSPLNKHELILNEMGIDVSEFHKARMALEGIGLLKTYKNKVGKSSATYLYELYAPKSPSDFFDDVIYKGMLSKKIGAKEVEKLTLMLASTPIEKTDYEEITAKFSEVYNVDEDEALKVINLKSSRGRKSINIVSDFNLGEFLKEMNESNNISPDAFTPDDLNEISRLATLFGFDVSSMVDIVSRVYDENEINHLSFEQLFSLCSKYKEGINIIDTSSNEIKEYSADDKFAQKLNEMNAYSPFEFLRLKQSYTNPSPADIKIINILSQKYHFNGPVINAIIDYTLIQCDDSLPIAYVEKIAATLVRKKVTTALAACNALIGNKKNKSQNKNIIVKEQDNVENETEVDLDEILKDIGDL